MSIPYTGLAVLQSNGSPSGVVFPQGVGQLCIDRTTPALYQATGFGDTDWEMIAGGGGGSITEIVAGSGIDITDGSGPTVTVAAIGGGGGIASMSGAGVDTSPGLITQAGGFNVNDTEGDGVGLFSTGVMNIGSSDLLQINIPSAGGAFIASQLTPGKLTLGYSGFISISPNNTPLSDLPITVVNNVNDNFVYTPSSTGVPETFTLAPQVITTLAEFADAVNSSIGSTSNERFDSLYGCGTDGEFLFISNFAGTGGTAVGDTVTTGSHDILQGPSGMGFNSGNAAIAGTDELALFGATPIVQPTITGNLTAVIDANVKNLLTSLIAALSATAGLGAFIDATT